MVSTPILGAGIAATAGGTDYLLGGQSSFLFTTTGGDAGKASTLSITTKHKKLSKPAGITVTGKLSPAAGNERVTRELPAAGLGPLAAPDGQDGGQRLVHDELARAARAATASWPSGRATSAPRATAPAC